MSHEEPSDYDQNKGIDETVGQKYPESGEYDSFSVMYDRPEDMFDERGYKRRQILQQVEQEYKLKRSLERQSWLEKQIANLKQLIMRPSPEQQVMSPDVQALVKKVKDLQTELRVAYGKSIEERLLTKARPWPSNFIHQTLSLDPGQSGTVYSFSAIRPGTVAFLRYLGVKWFSNCTIWWQIDGSDVEVITRTIGNPAGAMSDPARLDPPYEVTSNIRFFAQNLDTVTHVFEVVAYGEIVPIEGSNQIAAIRQSKML